MRSPTRSSVAVLASAAIAAAAKAARSAGDVSTDVAAAVASGAASSPAPSAAAVSAGAAAVADASSESWAVANSGAVAVSSCGGLRRRARRVVVSVLAAVAEHEDPAADHEDDGGRGRQRAEPAALSLGRQRRRRSDGQVGRRGDRRRRADLERVERGADGGVAACSIRTLGHPHRLAHGPDPGDLGDDLRIGLGARLLVGGDLFVEVGVGEQSLVVVHGAGGGAGGLCGVGRPEVESWFPSASASCERPLAIRDFTVPSGIDRTSAISA